MQNNEQNVDHSSGINFWWGVLSFFIPIVGLILQIIWWKDRHSNAKACMYGWIAGIVCGLLLPMIGSMIFAGLASANLL